MNLFYTSQFQYSYLKQESLVTVKQQRTSTPEKICQNFYKHMSDVLLSSELAEEATYMRLIFGMLFDVVNKYV